MFWIKSKTSILKLILVSIFSLLILGQSLVNSQDTKEESNNKSEEKDKIFDEVLSIKLKSMEGLQNLLKDNDITYFVYYYKTSSPNSRHGAAFLKSIAQKLSYLAGIIMIDCDQIEPKDTPLCQKDPEAADGFPKMEVYSPPELKYNPYTNEVNTHTRKMYSQAEVSENLIYNFITQNIPAKSIKLNAENFEMFVTNQEFNKVILFTDKSKTPLLFRGLSNYFYDRLMFGEVEKDQIALIKKFKVTKFPSLIVYQTNEDEILLDEPIIELYKGPIKADAIAGFIGEYARKETLSNRLNKSKDNTEGLKYKVAFKTLGKNDIMRFMSKFSDKRFVIYANDKEEIPQDIRTFNKMTTGFFYFVNINCKLDSETETFCKSVFKLKEIPSLLLYKNVDKNIAKSLEQPAIRLPLDYSGIETTLYREYNGYLKETNPSTFSALNNEANINKKVPFIYLHEGEVPLGLYLISTEEKYTKHLEFAVYEHPPKEILKQLQVTKLPQSIILLQDQEKKDSARVLTYNEELVYSRLGQFLNQYFNKERNTKIDDKQEDVKEEISFIPNNKAMESHCIKGKKLCMLAFLDGRVNADSMKQFDNSIKVLENVGIQLRKLSRPTSFNWVNATCHTDLAINFNINTESLPNLVIYVPSRNLFANLIGTFDEDTINAFTEKVLQGKVNLQKIERSNVVMTERNCEEIRDAAESSEDDDLIREILEEEKKKREEFEKERANLDTGAKSKKKKKKKKADL